MVKRFCRTLSLLCAGALLVASAHGKELTPPAAASQFVALNPAQLQQQLTATTKSQVQQIAAPYHCALSDAKGYHSPKDQQAPLVLLIRCDQMQLPEEEPYSEYPIILLVKGDQVRRISNTNEFGFMYETGEVKFITDLDGNQQPEFWLSGDLCECDVEPDEPCPCDNPGGKVVEVQGSAWQLWHQGTGWNAK